MVFKNGLLLALCTFLVTPSVAEETRRIKTDGATIEVHAGNLTDIPTPFVKVGNLELRSYRDMQTIIFVKQFAIRDGLHEADDTVVVLQVWPGNPACGGYLRIVSVTRYGLYHSPTFGDCLDAYDIRIEAIGDASTLVFRFYPYGDRNEKPVKWIYANGTLNKMEK